MTHPAALGGRLQPVWRTSAAVAGILLLLADLGLYANWPPAAAILVAGSVAAGIAIMVAQTALRMKPDFWLWIARTVVAAGFIVAAAAAAGLALGWSAGAVLVDGLSAALLATPLFGIGLANGMPASPWIGWVLTASWAILAFGGTYLLGPVAWVPLSLSWVAVAVVARPRDMPRTP